MNIREAAMNIKQKRESSVNVHENIHENPWVSTSRWKTMNISENQWIYDMIDMIWYDYDLTI